MWAEMPEQASDFYIPHLTRDAPAINKIPPVIATTFADFCWLLSQGTTSENVIQVNTPVAEELSGRKVALGDLSWYLPSKFADDVIDGLQVLNMTLLEGLLEEAVLYGPF